MDLPAFVINDEQRQRYLGILWEAGLVYRVNEGYELTPGFHAFVSRHAYDPLVEGQKADATLELIDMIKGAGVEFDVKEYSRIVFCLYEVHSGEKNPHLHLPEQ